MIVLGDSSGQDKDLSDEILDQAPNQGEFGTPHTEVVRNEEDNVVYIDPAQDKADNEETSLV